jgi:hypothetical protein
MWPEAGLGYTCAKIVAEFCSVTPVQELTLWVIIAVALQPLLPVPVTEYDVVIVGDTTMDVFEEAVFQL